MPVNKVYTKAAEAAVASYDWVDISEGTGKVKFYLFNSATSATGFRNLGRSIIHSLALRRNASLAAGSALTKVLSMIVK